MEWGAESLPKAVDQEEPMGWNAEKKYWRCSGKNRARRNQAKR
jgi:hypothetical protein